MEIKQQLLKQTCTWNDICFRQSDWCPVAAVHRLSDWFPTQLLPNLETPPNLSCLLFSFANVHFPPAFSPAVESIESCMDSL